MGKINRTQYKHYSQIKTEPYVFFIDSDFDWACDACLGSGKAIKADPALQNYCWHPHYAYFDTKRICKTCKTEFIFSKEEKKLWFEDLKFWTDAVPNNCLNCRREIRIWKQENKRISEILRKVENDISSEELKTVIEIYTSWEMEGKVKYYQAILRKRNKRRT